MEAATKLFIDNTIVAFLEYSSHRASTAYQYLQILLRDILSLSRQNEPFLPRHLTYDMQVQSSSLYQLL
jgi:hypothetical protein